jgi:putative sterol carrier protein
MAIDGLMENLRSRAALAPKLGYRVKFDLGEVGVILFDGTQDTLRVAAGDGEADSTLTLSAEALQQLIDGALDPTFAYMTGKMKISGSMGVALKLAAMLED